MSAVGAFQWKGGYQKYNHSRAPVDSFQKGNSNDSYLGENPLKTQPKQCKWGGFCIGIHKPKNTTWPDTRLSHPYVGRPINCCQKVGDIQLYRM